MKALLLKDFYVLWKQMRIFLLLIVVFSALPGGYSAIFAVTYAALLPYSCVAYDERSKWDQLAAMLPYTVRDLVLSRYVLGWIAALGTGMAVPAGPGALLPGAPPGLLSQRHRGRVFRLPRHSGCHHAADLPLRRGTGPAHHVPDYFPGVRLRRRPQRHRGRCLRCAARSGPGHRAGGPGADGSVRSPFHAVVCPPVSVR